MDIVNGINEEELGKLCVEILDYSDRISEIFDKVDSCMESLPNHYQGLPCVELLNYYNNLKTYYSTIKSNIVSYSDDLIALIKKMQDGSNEIVKLFQTYTDDTNKIVKSIMN